MIILERVANLSLEMQYYQINIEKEPNNEVKYSINSITQFKAKPNDEHFLKKELILPSQSLIPIDQLVNVRVFISKGCDTVL